MLRLLGHADRIELIQLLAARGEHSVSSIAQDLELPKTRVSQHLAQLRAHKLVYERTEGRRRFYALTDEGLAAWLLGGLPYLIGRFGDVTENQAEDARSLWTRAFARQLDG